MMIRMFNELKKDIQKQLNESQENSENEIEKTQKQLNEEIREEIKKVLQFNENESTTCQSWLHPRSEGIIQHM
jgi:TRAP-type C4-dicarboxylate transport system substrate-binding protein